MKANNQAKIFARKRVPLQSVLPLQTPFFITVEPTNFCNLKCNFCYHYDREAIKKENLEFCHMDFDLFKKIVDDILEFPDKIKKFKFGGFGEPLLNKQLPEMIRYAKEKGIAEKIDLFTNGTLLNEFNAKELVDAGLDWVNISINGLNREQYKERCSNPIDFESMVEGIAQLYKNKKQLEIYIKLGDNGASEEDKEKFYNTFGNICDNIFVEKIVDNVWNDVNLDVKDASPVSSFGDEDGYRHVCTPMFIGFMINANGTVVPCCADWKHQYKLGDANTQRLVGIWNGEPLKKLHIIHLKKQREDYDFCKNCNVPTAFTVDNIDPYTDELLPKYDI